VSGAQHAAEPFELLYIGIAPSSARSRARLRSRVIGQHVRGNIAASTFRFGLASLLHQKQSWTPRRTPSGRVTLDAGDDRALREWQRKHLMVGWCAVACPWCFEPGVVRALRPPMNRQHNEGHTYFNSMGLARAAFRAAARAD
jgi:hypothetical protein